jgi:hypothetical protein
MTYIQKQGIYVRVLDIELYLQADLTPRRALRSEKRAWAWPGGAVPSVRSTMENSSSTHGQAVAPVSNEGKSSGETRNVIVGKNSRALLVGSSVVSNETERCCKAIVGTVPESYLGKAIVYRTAGNITSVVIIAEPSGLVKLARRLERGNRGVTRPPRFLEGPGGSRIPLDIVLECPAINQGVQSRSLRNTAGPVKFLRTGKMGKMPRNAWQAREYPPGFLVLCEADLLGARKKALEIWDKKQEENFVWPKPRKSTPVKYIEYPYSDERDAVSSRTYGRREGAVYLNPPRVKGEEKDRDTNRYVLNDDYVQIEPHTRERKSLVDNTHDDIRRNLEQVKLRAARRISEPEPEKTRNGKVVKKRKRKVKPVKHKTIEQMIGKRKINAFKESMRGELFMRAKNRAQE